MKTLKILIRIEAVLLALLGGLEAFSIRNLGEAGASRAPQDELALSFLGTGLIVFAVLLFVGNDLLLAGSLRRLGLLLAAGNVVLLFPVFAHAFKPTVDGALSYYDATLVTIPLVMAGALAGASLFSLFPLKPEDAAAELTNLRIPDEVRQALLRQVGESAAQEERNRLARDLHDSIKQQLFTINVGAATAQERWERDPEGARAALVDVRRSAREAMVEMQAMLHQLRPQALTSATGLVEALREQAEALEYRSGARVTVELGPEIPDDRMPPGALEALLRIAQEALANVARHARAGRVRVGLGVRDEEIVLRVEDDGQGFDPKAVVSGMGLRNLQERAAALRGRIEIESEPGTGSAVTARIPLLSPPASAAQAQVARAFLGSPRDAIFFSLFSWTTVSLTQTGEPGIVAIVLASLFFSGAIALRVWGAKRWRNSDSQRGYLRFETHRDTAVLFFAAAAHLSPFWSSGSVPAEEIPFWQAGTLVCLLLSLLELAAFRRWSERAPAPPSDKPANLWAFGLYCALCYGILGVAFLRVIIGIIFGGMALAPSVMLALLGAGGLYILFRQPHPEGGPA